jgi:hypothetical protein
VGERGELGLAVLSSLVAVGPLPVPRTQGPAGKKNEILLPADRQSCFDDVH